MDTQAAKSVRVRGGKYAAKKRKKRWIAVVIICVIAAAALVIPRLMAGEKLPVLTLSDTSLLTVGNLEDSISATGTVESAETTMVYSTLAYPVMAVHVEVGDRVTEGELLAELDGAAIERQIASQEIAMTTSANSGAIQVQTAQDNYENFKSGVDQGLNTTLLSARTQADNALDAYEKAQKAYERYTTGLEDGENTTMISAEAALRNARNAVETAYDNYEAAEEAGEAAWDTVCEMEETVEEKDLALQEITDRQTEIELQLEQLQTELDALEPDADATELERQIRDLEHEASDLDVDSLRAEAELMMAKQGLAEAEAALDMSDNQLTAAEKAWQTAQENYETQKATYRATVTTVDNTVEDYATNVDTAWKAYQTALTNLQAAEKAVQDQMESYSNSVAGAQAGTNNAVSAENLRQLKQTLEDTKVTAPCSGTVTAVYAQIGGAGSGLLFVIEDVDALVVATTVKGYDMGTVKEGMKVDIRSDATGSEPLEGVITFIAPTAEKNMQGMTSSASDPRFAAEVKVLTVGSGLRIGMEAQLDYIVTEVFDVLTAPYDAVYENEDGQACVLVAEEREEQTYFLREVPVTTGAANNLDIVISGEGLTAGVLVVHAPENYRALAGTLVQGSDSVTNEILAMMGRGG